MGLIVNTDFRKKQESLFEDEFYVLRKTDYNFLL